MDGNDQISDKDLASAIEALARAISIERPDDRREELGRAVRTVTRLWALANPGFDQDAWYPVSYMLTEHWSQIRAHMENAEA